MSADKSRIKGTLPGRKTISKMRPGTGHLRCPVPGRVHETGPGGQDAAGFARWYREKILEQWRGLDLESVAKLADAVVRAQEDGRQVFILGNGGSAATASHMATDFSKTAALPDKPLLRCLSLTDNVSFITAAGNDISFDDIFVRQLENLLEKGDLVLLISGSGNSKNLVKAAEYASSLGAETIALLGFDGGKLAETADFSILVPSDQYGVIEDMHLSVGHIITFYLKQRH